MVDLSVKIGDITMQNPGCGDAPRPARFFSCGI